jgi:L,D-peptidoglycan transpeptidase YkuD (ErfK/YbiS/YcfS/YnhG family)
VHTAKPTFAALTSAASTTPATTPARGASSAVAPSTATHPATTAAAPSSTAPARPAATTTRPAASPTHVTPARTTSAAPRPAAAQRGVSLPLHYTTGTATRVITVTAHSYGSTTATLQAWSKVAAGGWRRYGSSVTAHVGSQGLTTHASESRSATPVGSFTLTRAFGRYSDPGTALPYLHTNSHDWWVSQAGSYYNTHVRCSSSCPIRQDPNVNEHLYYEMPYYRYAVVIDYNTRNAPGGVRAGAGSAFFLHVTDGRATAGCVAIGQAKLISLMRWLTPSAHPRIIIGVG